MMPPEDYLRAKGWHKSGAVLWRDQVTGQAYGLNTAIDLQVLRDADCEKFRRSRQGHMVLEQCTASNAAQAAGDKAEA